MPRFTHTPEPSSTTASAWIHFCYFSCLCSSSPWLFLSSVWPPPSLYTPVNFCLPSFLCSFPLLLLTICHICLSCRTSLQPPSASLPQHPFLSLKFISGNSSSGECRWSFSQLYRDFTSPSFFVAYKSTNEIGLQNKLFRIRIYSIMWRVYCQEDCSYCRPLFKCCGFARCLLLCHLPQDARDSLSLNRDLTPYCALHALILITYSKTC